MSLISFNRGQSPNPAETLRLQPQISVNVSRKGIYCQNVDQVKQALRGYLTGNFDLLINTRNDLSLAQLMTGQHVQIYDAIRGQGEGDRDAAVDNQTAGLLSMMEATGGEGRWSNLDATQGAKNSPFWNTVTTLQREGEGFILGITSRNGIPYEKDAAAALGREPLARSLSVSVDYPGPVVSAGGWRQGRRQRQAERQAHAFQDQDMRSRLEAVHTLGISPERIAEAYHTLQTNGRVNLVNDKGVLISLTRTPSPTGTASTRFSLTVRPPKEMGALERDALITRFEPQVKK